MSDNIVIQTRALTKTYGGNINALKNLDLTVNKNSIYGFLGPNGAGKTTTIKILLGLINPTSGRASILGNDIFKNHINIRKNLGYLSQNPRFYDFMTAREILIFTTKFFFNGPKSKINERVDDILGLVSLTKKADRKVYGFSGGERQRLGIAQAMINYPDLLILDEPAAALDPIGRRDVLEIMERLSEYTTIFYSTHILDDVQKVSDRVAILNYGELIAEGPINELLVGSDGILYDVNVKGKLRDTKLILEDYPWIESINEENQNGLTKWLIKITDEETAEQQLLRQILQNEDIIVTKFQKKEYELEEIFMRIVEGTS